MPPQKDSDYCFAHDPHKSKERTAARKRGGEVKIIALKHPLPQVSLKSQDDARDFLEKNVNELRSGLVDPRIVGIQTNVGIALFNGYAKANGGTEFAETKQPEPNEDAFLFMTEEERDLVLKLFATAIGRKKFKESGIKETDCIPEPVRHYLEEQKKLHSMSLLQLQEANWEYNEKWDAEYRSKRERLQTARELRAARTRSQISPESTATPETALEPAPS
jgi:hypothetical protein